MSQPDKPSDQPEPSGTKKPGGGTPRSVGNEGESTAEFRDAEFAAERPIKEQSPTSPSRTYLERLPQQESLAAKQARLTKTEAKVASETSPPAGAGAESQATESSGSESASTATGRSDGPSPQGGTGASPAAVPTASPAQAPETSSAASPSVDVELVQDLSGSAARDAGAPAVPVRSGAQVWDAEPAQIPNATAGKPFRASLYKEPDERIEQLRQLQRAGRLKSYVRGLEVIGLKYDAETMVISGTPTLAGEHMPTCVIYREDPDGGVLVLKERQIRIFINPDPRSLWKELEPEPGLPYPKGHTDCRRELVGDTVLLGASRRGRSHAHNATFRDDDFTIGAVSEGWILVAVADGAGSAKFSRRGSEIICRTTMEGVQASLSKYMGDTFEQAIARHRSESSNDSEREIRSALYQALVPAAHAAVKAIAAEAQAQGAELKDYATTLVLTVSKRFSFGWFVACFAIGDGGAALLLDPAACAVRVLNQQEGGEFSGQTRFATMTEVWKDSSDLFNNRIQFAVVDDFVALLAMTDGVSDPFFRTDNEFNTPAKWVEFWKMLGESVRLSKDNESAHRQLLEWLAFWVEGEHDDRTLALLLP